MSNSSKKISRTKTTGRDSKSGKKNENRIETSEAVSRQDAASYINEMAFEMKSMAEKAKLSFLSYLLGLVIEESGTQKRGRILQHAAENDGRH